MPPISHFSREILKLCLPFYIDIFVCRKVLDDQGDCLYPGLHMQNGSMAEIFFTSPKLLHTFSFPRKCLSCPTRKPSLGSLGYHFLLNYAEGKKNQMSFCTLESNCRPYNSFFFPLCNLYINYILVAFREIHPLQICFVFGRQHLQL